MYVHGEDLSWRSSSRIINSFDLFRDVFPASPQPPLLPFLSPSGACHEFSFFLRPSSLSRFSLISHRSLILFHASGTSVQFYLLIIIAKHVDVISYRFLQYLFFIHFSRLAYRVSHVSHGNFIVCRKFRHLHTPLCFITRYLPDLIFPHMFF